MCPAKCSKWELHAEQKSEQVDSAKEKVCLACMVSSACKIIEYTRRKIKVYHVAQILNTVHRSKYRLCSESAGALNSTISWKYP